MNTTQPIVSLPETGPKLRAYEIDIYFKAKLIWLSPGGFEQYFLDMEELVKNEPAWPPSDLGKVFDLMAKHDTYPS